MNNFTSNRSYQLDDETVTLGKSSVHAGIYGRVSSDQQAEQQTIQSQISALRERVEADGYSSQQPPGRRGGIAPLRGEC